MLQYQKMVRHEGNKDLFMALEMAVMSLNNCKPLNIHAYGLRGTGKTSVMRSIKKSLPMIKRIKNCPYNCSPDQPTCPLHRDMTPEEVQALGFEWIPMPMLEISHSAKIGTIVGSIDLHQLTNQAKAQVALLPGTIAQANRGILFVDEINRLADTAPELTDILLDVMGTKPGLLQIEEEGMPKVSMPVNISVWAASNPDEDPGPLSSIRKQLSDRFDITVHVKRPNSTADLIAIILDNTDCKEAQHIDWNTANLKLHEVKVADELLHKMATTFIHYDLESMRALKSWYLASKINALWHGQSTVLPENIRETFKLCFQHRLSTELLNEIQKDLDSQNSENQMQSSSPDDHPQLPPKEPEQQPLLRQWMSRLAHPEQVKQQEDNEKKAQANSSAQPPIVSPKQKARRFNLFKPGKRVYHNQGPKNDY